MTVHQLHHLLVSKGYDISLRTILCCCASLGWTFCGSAYYQMIQETNKAKRLQWAIDNQGLDFDDVVWTDKCTVQLESHRRFCCRKVGQRPRNTPRQSYNYCNISLYVEGCQLHVYIQQSGTHLDTNAWHVKCTCMSCMYQLIHCLSSIVCRAKHPVKVHFWLGSASEEQLGSVSLRAQWTKNSLRRSQIRPWCLTYTTLRPTDSCNTMIQSIHVHLTMSLISWI